MQKLIATGVILLSGVCFSCSASDAQSERLFIGEWQGGRHSVQYKQDHTFRLDPAEGTTHGKWRIQDSRFIMTWPTGESVSYEILVLDKKAFVIRSDDGTIFTHTRMTHPLPQ